MMNPIVTKGKILSLLVKFVIELIIVSNHGSGEKDSNLAINER